MKRRLFNIATAASAITAMLLLVLAVTTAKRTTFAITDLQLGNFGLRVAGGELLFVWGDDFPMIQATVGRGPNLSEVAFINVPSVIVAGTFFFESVPYSKSPRAPVREVYVHSPLLAFWGFFDNAEAWWTLDLHLASWIALFFLLPMIWALGRLTRRLKAHPPGYCQTCAYDLRESRDACPECGRPIAVREA